MTTERDLLSALQDVLGSADVDAAELVDEAWAEARDEVQATLKRLMANDLLARALATLERHVDRPVSTSDLRSGPTAVPESPPVTVEAPAPDAAEIEEPEPEPEPETEPEPERHEPRSMTYLFGVVGPHANVPSGELPTLPGGGELRFVDGPGCRALVSDVDPQLFEVLREPGPEGLDLLTAAAHAHDAILARFAGRPVLPLGLGTALLDDRAVAKVLTKHASLLQDELARIGDHAEWAVTVHTFDRTAPEDAGEDEAASGREYLERRRHALDAREDRWERQDRLAAELHGPLAACAVEALRVESRPLEDAAPPLLHGVYLLDEGSRGRFDSTVAYLRAEYPDAVVEVSGPWPPYHFVTLNLAVDGEPAS